MKVCRRKCLTCALTGFLLVDRRISRARKITRCYAGLGDSTFLSVRSFVCLVAKPIHRIGSVSYSIQSTDFVRVKKINNGKPHLVLVRPWWLHCLYEKLTSNSLHTRSFVRSSYQIRWSTYLHIEEGLSSFAIVDHACFLSFKRPTPLTIN